MKRTSYIIACLALLLAPACSDWFDIVPKTDVKAELLFDSPHGFSAALAGVYITMTEDKTYGANLTFGMPEQLAQMYDMLPDQQSFSNVYDYKGGGFKLKGRFTEVWNSSYNMIANLNNLIKWLDLRAEEVLADENLIRMYYGECYGLRAFLHFNLLRAWGPMAAQNDDPCMPYRLVIDNSKQPKLAPSRIVELLLADLQTAADYLAYEKESSLSDNSRRNRMNYHAVKATQARVHLYAGQMQEAYDCADEVIAHCGLKLQTENATDPILYDETLFGIHMYNMEDALTSYFQEAPTLSHLYITPRKFQTLMEASGTSGDFDIRVSNRAVRANVTGDRMITMKYIKNDNAIIPLIRLPEMYYIKCEAAPLDKAATFIDQVRNKRGYTTSQSYKLFRTPESRIAALDKEYRKEFYAEGQYWWFLKRQGTLSLPHSDVSLFPSDYVFPLPDNEVEYGWTDETEESLAQ